MAGSWTRMASMHSCALLAAASSSATTPFAYEWRGRPRSHNSWSPGHLEYVDAVLKRLEQFPDATAPL
eukprot:12899312-Prorocentrum_lima.AAC.1